MKAAEVKEEKKEEVANERQPLTGPVEEPTNESEKKIFDLLNQMGIPHVCHSSLLFSPSYSIRPPSNTKLPRLSKMSSSTAIVLLVFPPKTFS